jgi:hypothetical protein
MQVTTTDTVQSTFPPASATLRATP